MVLQHNVTAMNAQRQFNITSDKQEASTQKLSSGYKINKAADDAAGLAISENMRRQIRGLTQGVSNTQDGVSMCQVGDGALAEVHDMLNRMTELSVKAANDTLTVEDRDAIQREIIEIKNEIDRIGNNTTFNDIYLFKGDSEFVTGAGGQIVKKNDFAFDDIKIADLTINNSPISGTTGSTLAFSAKVDNAASAANGQTFGLIFGDGGTSHSKIRVSTSKGTKEVDLNSVTTSTPQFDAVNKTWSRDYVIDDADTGAKVTIKQTIGTKETTDSKSYEISYTVKNDSAESAKVDFLFNADTAYNNNDSKDNYFVNGNYLSHHTVYKSASATLGDVDTNANVISGIPSSLTLVDKDDALPFTENFSWAGSNPDVVAVGPYSSIANFSYYTDGILNGLPNTDSGSTDLGFSVIWNDKNLAAGASTDFKLSYGIKATENDPNLTGTGVTVSDAPLTRHVGHSQFWIQAGSEAGSGMYISFGEMNSTVLGINGVDVSTHANASNALGTVKNAMNSISEMRATIGAQQNRLEHTIANESNIVENTTSAESAIRDTDMAKEMVEFSLMNILSNAGTSMMAQANQSNQSVLSLLQ